MCRAAADAIQTLAADRLGGRLGFSVFVHTWGGTLVWHPHVHVLVPGIAVHSDRTFSVLPAAFLLPVRALSEVFSGMFMTQARRQFPDIPSVPRSKKWVVHCRACKEGPANVLRYLIRYALRAPVSEKDIVEVTSRLIRFRHTDHGTRRSAFCSLSPHEFLRRLLQHAPPKGFRRIRHYGFMAPGGRKTLTLLKLALAPGMAALEPLRRRLAAPFTTRPPRCCPRCGSTNLRHLHLRIPLRTRAPPPQTAA